MSSPAWTSCASTGTRFPPAEAGSIIARRWRTELALPAHDPPQPLPFVLGQSAHTDSTAAAPPAVGSGITAHPTQPPHPPTRRTYAVTALTSDQR
ncbi:hypothetical protein ADK57_12320 [Streptomyces sp. MMG1533]|nr:hypothetical protein ADK57_12320 [Streptomyces sp. MMG1533]